MKIFALMVFCTALLSGCSVYTPSGSVHVDPGARHGGGTFCPPGQAKKGNC